MSQPLKELLLAFEAEIQHRNPLLFNLFNPGLEENLIINLLRGNNIAPDRRIIDLFAWKNGTAYSGIHSGKMYFGPTAILPTLDEAINTYNAFVNQGALQSNFFPISNEDYYLFNLEMNDPIIYVIAPSLAIMTPLPAYESVESMFETIIDALRTGIVTYDAEGICVVDFEAYSQFVRSRNPSSQF